jgi:signal transduction histidine kinase
MFANDRLIKNAEAVERTNQIISNLGNLLSEVKDAETGFRGYVISKNPSFLEPYFGSKRAADSIYQQTNKLIGSKKEQVAGLKVIKANIDLKYHYIEDNLNLIRAGNFNITANNISLAKEIMDTIRKDVFDMQLTEQQTLKQGNLKLEKTRDAVSSIVIASIIIAFFLVVFGFSSHIKESRDRMLAEKKIQTYQDELKKRIKELAEANEALVQMKSQEKFAATGRIARTIAHEIRNPLTNINLAAEQLNAEMPAKDENSAFLFDMIDRNSNRINQLISDLLNSTKFSDLQYEKVSINELINDTLKEAEDRILLHEVKLVKKYASNICDIMVDKTKIKIAFLNIIINAIEAMEGIENPEFTIETKAENDRCVVIISDNGTGLDDESTSKLFEPYFTSKPRGNGLGLTNTQNIILNHRGNIAVTSRKGFGTSFVITLNIDS